MKKINTILLVLVLISLLFLIYLNLKSNGIDLSLNKYKLDTLTDEETVTYLKIEAPIFNSSEGSITLQTTNSQPLNKKPIKATQVSILASISQADKVFYYPSTQSLGFEKKFDSLTAKPLNDKK